VSISTGALMTQKMPIFKVLPKTLRFFEKFFFLNVFFSSIEVKEMLSKKNGEKICKISQI
jgi:hypothetical protein